MSSDVSFRLATEEDALCIGALGTQVWLDTYATGGIRPSLAREVIKHFSLDGVASTLAKPDTALLLAERQDHLVAFAQLRYDAEHSVLPDRSAVELERLYVQEAFTGRGIGKRLLLEVETLVGPHGANTIWLNAWVGNRRALGFYTAQGYEDIGSDWYSFDGESHENRVFAKRLD
ncbi:GNAT family N-acetyltransferase [Pseudomonas sp.]|jgi:GNAT superfamily N-acetyltransferase|uniref:GNAT family N-acetyltransferase n=1 Tax=Pseudomonas sp. TaxID=306 RepID=UPI00260FE692|nr:GNAT family N-acetyltransferase [Pseudomonas sp.]